MRNTISQSQDSDNNNDTKSAGHTHTLDFLVAFYVLAAMWGIRQLWSWQSSFLDWIIAALLAGCLAWWAFVDARLRRHPILMLARGWFLLFAIPLVPCYCIWSRRMRGLVWVIVHFIGWFTVSFFAALIFASIFFGIRR